MKNYYKIHEISKLYGIGVDSLRYYERLGILKPRRDTNNYRLYSLKDIYKLNIIRDLRGLGFSMERIKEYLDGQCVENTLNLLQEEHALLTKQLQELQQKKQILEERMEDLYRAQHTETECFQLKTVAKDRHCVQLSEYITKDEQMDFAFKRLHSRYEGEIRNFGNLVIGAYPCMEKLMAGISNVYDSVFFILGPQAKNYEFTLPAGEYLSCYYRGSYQQNSARMREFLAYAEAKGYQLAGVPFELYEVDNHDTMDEGEFLTEIQALVRAADSQS